MADVLVDREVLGYALFALGRFVDYRISDGMSEDAVHPFMQAYLDLEATLDGREPPCLRELQSQTVVVPPALMPETQTITPAWLPDGKGDGATAWDEDAMASPIVTPPWTEVRLPMPRVQSKL